MEQLGRFGREAVFADSVGFLRLFPGWLFSSQEVFHPGYQLRNGEGLFKIVIGSQVESGHDVIHGGLCEEKADTFVTDRYPDVAIFFFGREMDVCAVAGVLDGIVRAKSREN